MNREYRLSQADSPNRYLINRPDRLPFSPRSFELCASIVPGWLLAIAAPLNGTFDIAGPEKYRLSVLAARFMKSQNDSRPVVADPHALYFGTELLDGSLVPAGNARLGRVSFESWLSHYQPRK